MVVAYDIQHGISRASLASLEHDAATSTACLEVKEDNLFMPSPRLTSSLAPNS